jgi:hypothetical protein
MKMSRCVEWIAVFDWFQKIDMTQIVARKDWEELYRLLDSMWEDERRKRRRRSSQLTSSP